MLLYNHIINSSPNIRNKDHKLSSDRFIYSNSRVVRPLLKLSELFKLMQLFSKNHTDLFSSTIACN